ncbi:hypothetical protein ES707_06982 [subsurface metagenome]
MRKVVLVCLVVGLISSLAAREVSAEKRKLSMALNCNYFAGSFSYNEQSWRSIDWPSELFNKEYYFEISRWYPQVIFPELSMKYAFKAGSCGLSFGYAFMSRSEKDWSSTSNYGIGDYNNDGIDDDVVGYSTMTITQKISFVPVYGFMEMNIISNEKRRLYLGTGFGVNFLQVKEKYANEGETVSFDYSDDGTIDETKTTPAKTVRAKASKAAPYGRVYLGIESVLTPRISIHSSIGMQFAVADMGSKSVEKVGRVDFGRWNISGKVFNLGLNYHF